MNADKPTARQIMPGHGGKFTRLADAFVENLLAQPDLAQAAKATGISRDTARRWLQDPRVAAQYREARREALGHAVARLQAASGEAVETMVELCREAAIESTKLAAAKAILDAALRAAEIDDLTERVAALEAYESQRAA